MFVYWLKKDFEEQGRNLTGDRSVCTMALMLSRSKRFRLARNQNWLEWMD